MTESVQLLKHGRPASYRICDACNRYARGLSARVAMRIPVIGLTLYFATAQGAVVFIPSFMIRNHGLSITETGLLVGVAAAKALALGLGKPLYGVNHLASHVAVDQLDDRDRRDEPSRTLRYKV